MKNIIKKAKSKLTYDLPNLIRKKMIVLINLNQNQKNKNRKTLRINFRCATIA